MKDALPDYLVQGDQARLFPVLSTTSKEGRTTSIVLACIAKIDEFGEVLLASLGQRVGLRTKINTFTEVVCKNQIDDKKDRPDGLIVVKTGNREWRALVETKVANNDLVADQVEKYRVIAKDNAIDCVITISNQFATTPQAHPLPEVQKSRSKILVYHWSWMYIRTEADLLIDQDKVKDANQRMLLNELRVFLRDDSAGVKGFHRMPKEWSDLIRLVASGGVINAKSNEASSVLSAWHQETRDLSLILSRLTGTTVTERLSRKNRSDPLLRSKDEMKNLCENKQLKTTLQIPDAAAPLEVTVDLSRKTIDVGMTLRAPEDKVSTKARVNWLLRQIKSEKAEDIYVRLLWPGKSPPNHKSVSELRQDPLAASEGKDHLSPHTFHVYKSAHLGSRFAQQTNFIADLEACVPDFYGNIGSALTAWKKSPPKIKEDRSTAAEVSVSSFSEDAADFDPN